MRPTVNSYTVQKTIMRYGEQMQQTVAMEECAELIKEISKAIRGQARKEHIAEEIADVLICIENIQQIHGIPDEKIQRYIDLKTDRILARINNAKTEMGV